MIYDFRNIPIVSQILSAEKSQEELDAINHYQTECDRLFQIGSSYQLDPAHPELYYGDQIAYSQVATGGTIHRGVYCPSPIYDIIIGRTHRGKILQRPTKRSNITHQYYFDKDDKLCYTKRIYEGSHTGTEFLIPKEGRIYGITLELNGNLVAVCEEYHHEAKLKSYCYAEYWWYYQQANVSVFVSKNMATIVRGCAAAMYTRLILRYNYTSMNFTNLNARRGICPPTL